MSRTVDTMLLCMAVRWSDKFLPLDQRNLTDRIVNHMKDLIASHQLESGQKLPTEHELSKLLRVSRATVREAKKVLEAAGLIQIKPGNGSYVTGSAPQILTISDSLRFDNKQLSVKRNDQRMRTLRELRRASLKWRPSKMI